MVDIYRPTPDRVWKIIRAASKEDSLGAAGTLLAATDMVGGALERDQLSGVIDLYELFRIEFVSLVLGFYSDDSGHAPVDEDTFGYTVIGFPAGPKDNEDKGKGGTPLWICQSVAVNDCVLGKMTLGARPENGGSVFSGARWADTLTVDPAIWNADVIVSDSGNDRIATLRIHDLQDLRYIKVFIHGADGGVTATEVPSITVVGRIF